MIDVVVAAAVGAAAVGALAQAVTGFGFALVAVPLLALAAPTATAVVIVTVLSAVMTAGATVRERGNVNRRLSVRTTVAAVIGMPFGLLAFVLLPARALTLAVAGAALIFLTLPLLRRRRAPGGGDSIAPAGFVSGVALTATGMNGPPLVAAMRGLRLPAREQRATLQAIFTLQDVVAVALFAAARQTSGQIWLAAAVSVPALVVGWHSGDHIFRRLDDRYLRAIMTGLLGVTVIVLVVRAFWT